MTQYVARHEVGVFLVGKRGEAEEDVLARVKPYRKALRAKLGVKPRDEWGTTVLAMDTRDRTNWDRAAEWLHDQRKKYEQVLRNART